MIVPAAVGCKRILCRIRRIMKDPLRVREAVVVFDTHLGTAAVPPLPKVRSAHDEASDRPRRSVPGYDARRKSADGAPDGRSDFPLTVFRRGEPFFYAFDLLG
jgi:hypothetical protein